MNCLSSLSVHSILCVNDYCSKRVLDLKYYNNMYTCNNTIKTHNMHSTQVSLWHGFSILEMFAFVIVIRLKKKTKSRLYEYLII